jgi:chorismate-pyruvate lyase
VKKGDYGSGMLSKIGELERRSGIILETPQKILLAETGTVEQLLSILVGSDIKVRIVEQKEKKGVIARKSLITTESGRVLLEANSRIMTRSLPPAVVKQIRDQRKGIGSIIKDTGLETSRRITDIGYDPKKMHLFRRYKIIHKKKTVIEIKEAFVDFQIVMHSSR